MGSLARELDAFMDGLMERIDPGTAETLCRHNERLIAEHVSERTPRVGVLAPDFTLPDQDGRPVSLRATLARGCVVLVFFRGGWCPFCLITLRALARTHPALRRQGAEILAVSPQALAHTFETAERHGLPFPVLSDHDNDIARSYGLVVPMPADLQAVYRRFGHDLPAINGVPRWDLPFPAAFIIGRDGRIVHASVDPRANRRLEPEEALATIRRLSERTVA